MSGSDTNLEFEPWGMPLIGALVRWTEWWIFGSRTRLETNTQFHTT